ncbi:hypothetical protein [Tenacibaculum sp. 190524A05c]|uniref:TonB C-terminal domain-containing protein n=1 Tax=Tenacibaculum platacis TaxID=3137852 RepID=A0ABM9NQS8_9FLAO
MKQIIFFFTILLITSCGQKKTVESKPTQFLTKDLTEVPTFPNCETHKDWIDKELCLVNSIQELISKKAEESKLVLAQDTLKVGIRIEVDGSSTILSNKSNNKELESLSLKVLEDLPYIEPAISKKLNKKVTSGFSFYVIFKNNEITSKWER